MRCANKNERHERQYCMRHVQIADYFNRQNKGGLNHFERAIIKYQVIRKPTDQSHRRIQWNNVDDRNEIILFAFSIYVILIAITPWNQFHVPWSMESKFHKSFSFKKFQSLKIHSENWLDLEYSWFVFLKTFPAFNKFPSNFLSSFPFRVIQLVFYTTKLSKFEGFSDFACLDDVINTKFLRKNHLIYSLFSLFCKYYRL